MDLKIYILLAPLEYSILFLLMSTGRNIWRPSPCLSCRGTLLLPLSARVFLLRSRRPCPRRHLHCLHAWLVCLFLKNLDRSLRFFCKRCKSQLLFSMRCYLLIFLPEGCCVKALFFAISQVAKQLKEQQMVMRGHRETSMVHELNR